MTISIIMLIVFLFIPSSKNQQLFPGCKEEVLTCVESNCKNCESFEKCCEKSCGNFSKPHSFCKNEKNLIVTECSCVPKDLKCRKKAEACRLAKCENFQ